MLIPSHAVALLPRRLTAIIGVILALAAASCGRAAKGGETHVAREEGFHTGNVDYDDFFEDVSALQVNSKKATADEKSARAPLAQALGVGGDASMDKLLDAFRSKAEDLARSKSRVHIFFFGIDKQGHPIPGKKITVVAISGANLEVSKEALQLAKAIELTAQKESQVWDEYNILPEKGRRLEGKVPGMRASVDTEFPQLSKDKRNQIDQELKAAERVSGEIAQECDKVVKASNRFLKEASDIVIAAATIEAKPQGRGSKGKNTRPPSPPPEQSSPAEPVAPTGAPPSASPPAKGVRPKEPPPKPAPAAKDAPANPAPANPPKAAPAAKSNSPPPKKRSPPPAEPAPTKPADFNP
jgi:hypothetical protein